MAPPGTYNVPSPPSPSLGGGFLADITGGLSDRAGSWLGDKIFGVPKAKTAEQSGQESKSYMDIAFPGTNAWERLGGGGANAMSGAQAASAQRVNQRDQLNNQKELQNNQNRNQLKIVAAQIEGQKSINERTVDEQATRRLTIDAPKVPGEVEKLRRGNQKLNYEMALIKQNYKKMGHETQVLYNKTLMQLQEWERGETKHGQEKSEASMAAVKAEWFRLAHAAGLGRDIIIALGGAIALGATAGSLIGGARRLVKKGLKRMIRKSRKSSGPSKPRGVATPARGWTKVEEYDPTALDPR